MDKLKPCPFCGGEAMKMTSTDGFTSIGCLECNPVFGVMIQATTEAEAVKAWNTREERTCQMKDDGRFKYKHGGTGSEAKELFGTEWFTMEKSKCTACHKVTMHDDTIAYSYCPHCGAKAVGE